MKTRLRQTSLGAMLFCLFLAAAAQAGPLAPREGWVIKDTPYAYDVLVERLIEAVKGENMLVVTQASASGGAKAQGIVIPGNRVIGVYRNDYARRMLSASIAAGIEAPIRFYITEDADGTATLSYRTPSAVFAPYLDEGGKDLKTLAQELDSLFETIAVRAIE